MEKTRKNAVNFDEHGRECARCGEYKPWSAFKKNKRGINGKQSYCTCCTRKESNSYFSQDAGKNLVNRFRTAMRGTMNKNNLQLPKNVQMLSTPYILKMIGVSSVKELLDLFTGFDSNTQEIDHIIPKCTVRCFRDLYYLNHKTNLQVLSKAENMLKGGSVSMEDVEKVVSKHPKGAKIQKIVERHLEEKQEEVVTGG